MDTLDEEEGLDQPEERVQQIRTLNPGSRRVLDKRREERRSCWNTLLEHSNGVAVDKLLASLDFS